MFGQRSIFQTRSYLAKVGVLQEHTIRKSGIRDQTTRSLADACRQFEAGHGIACDLQRLTGELRLSEKMVATVLPISSTAVSCMG